MVSWRPRASRAGPHHLDFNRYHAVALTRLVRFTFVDSLVHAWESAFTRTLPPLEAIVAEHLSTVDRGRPATRPKHRIGSAGSVYEQVTNRIMAALEAGVVPWRKPWHEHSEPPCNAVSRRQYHGINLLLLGLSHYRDHRWLTYQQARELGGHVRLGEKASLAVFWKKWEVENPDSSTGELRRDHIPLLRRYYLFNVQQCESLALPELTFNNRSHPQRIEAAEALLRNMPNPPRLHEGCKQACYYPLVDVVQMPPLEAFVSSDAYYATLFHELGHSTGHTSRLKRVGITEHPTFGTIEYSREELVAELTSSFCCALIGLDNSVIDDAASYIGGWLKRLKSDPKVIVTAAGLAQRATDWIRGEDPAADRHLTEATS